MGNTPSVENEISRRDEAQIFPAAGLNIQVYDTLESLGHLRDDWESLLEAYPHATTFSTWEWLVPWWRAFGGQDRLRVLAAYDGGCLAGLGLLSLTSLRVWGSNLRVLRLWGDGTHDSDNLDLPLRPGYEVRFIQAVFRWLVDHDHEWDLCQLRTLPAQSPAAHCLVEELKARRWTPYFSTPPQSVIDLPETWEEYAKSLSAKERGKIGLRFRKLEKKYKLEIRKCTAESELDTCLGALRELHRRHWEQRGLPGTLHVPARQQFYRELAVSLLAKHRLEFWILSLDGKIVAAQFGMRHGKTVFSLQEGFDPEYSSDSVGYVLRSQVLKTLIADGVRRYDFLGGTDESKLRWGAKVNSYLNLEFARAHSKGSLYLGFRHKGAETKSWFRARVPNAILNAWRRVRS